MQDSKGHQGTAQRRYSKGEGTVRAGPLAGIVPITRELGIDPEKILERFGFTVENFDDPDFQIPYITGGRLLAQCAETTQCPHFGLLVGMRAPPSTLGIPGFLVQNAPDVGKALHALVHNLDLHDQESVVLFDTQGKSTMFGYAIQQPRVDSSEQIYDVAIAIACNIMRQLCGGDWSPTEVCFSRNAPPDLKPYRRFFKAPVRFNCELNALVFPSSWLNHKIPRADTLLYHHLEREANALHQSREVNILQDVHRLLRTSMISGHCKAKDIARQLCIHERTLHRRLNEQGTSFQLELNTVRDELARQLLTGSTTPIVRIAAMLNYSNVSAFNRAFKRWNGTTPGRWRDRNTA